MIPADKPESPESPEPKRPLTREEKAAKHQAMLEAARVAPRLDPMLWAPAFLVAPVKVSDDPIYRAYRADNRLYRAAFGRGEKHRKILLKCGTARARSLDDKA